jgi:hypothetical protein
VNNGLTFEGFLNDLVKLLWPNIRVAAGNLIKEIVEPMFAQMLPAPLDTLHFEKIDLGAIPIHLANIVVTQTDTGGGIKLDVDVEWDGECDIELNAKMIPKIVSFCPPGILTTQRLTSGKQGVEHIKLRGRLEVLLCPLTNVIPLVGNILNPSTIRSL